MNDGTDDVRIEVTLPGPLDEVWRAFRDPAVVAQWHGWEYEHLEDEIREIFLDGTVVEEERRTLHVGGHRFTFEEMGPQTIVRVTRAAPLHSDGMDWDAWYDDIDEGWRSFLQQLRFAMTRGWGTARRTIHLDGTATAPTHPAAALGLHVPGGPGERYAADVAGEHLSGEIWFRSTHQLGLTVDSWGPGLLVLVDAPNAGGTAASATMSLYGVADDDREARWSAAWRATYAG
jgi:hypothetical protein